MPPDLLTERQRRLLDAVLILGALALGFVVINFAGAVFYAFGDILLLFFLSWLLAFALLPVINMVARVPRMPPAGAVIIVYLAIVGVLLAIVIQASAALALLDQPVHPAVAPVRDPAARTSSPTSSRGWPRSGLTVDLVGQAPTIVANLQHWASQLVGPLQSVAVASIGVFGNILILVILSIYIAIDRDDILAFLYRLVPPSLRPPGRVLQSSVAQARSAASCAGS